MSVSHVMELIDTHAHLDEDAFSTDCDQVVERAVASGLSVIITIGTTAESSQRAVALAHKYPNVYAAVGIQPNYAAEAKAGDWELIEQLATENKVVALGETGLDRYWDYAPIELQAEYFSRHLDLSQKLQLPFVVHCRESEADVVAQLQDQAKQGPLSGVMHSFCGDQETAKACLDLGLLISFSGMLTYKKNTDLRSVAAGIPRERLLVETDSPYLSPTPLRGKRNEPANVKHTLECLAELHGISAEAMAALTTRNARELFQIQ